MLSKSKRVNLKTDFKWIVTGVRIQTSNFVIYKKLGDNSEARIGISMSKKSIKEANQRNRMRRLTSKYFEENYNTLPKNLNLVIMPKKVLTLEEVRGELDGIKDSYSLN